VPEVGDRAVLLLTEGFSTETYIMGNSRDSIALFAKLNKVVCSPKFRPFAGSPSRFEAAIEAAMAASR
jgi:hypothetical protein